MSLSNKVVIPILLLVTLCTPTEQSNSTEDKVLKRNKRFLIFGAAVAKSVLGISLPVQTHDKVNWRAMNMAYNFQAQYLPVPSVIYPWTRFERSLIDQKRQFDEFGTHVKDMTRQFVYTAIELMMNRQGRDGKQCLLRAICEQGQTPIAVNSIFDEILQLILMPNEIEISDEYINARRAGEFGANCFNMYRGCPNGYGLLDTISYFKF